MKYEKAIRWFIIFIIISLITSTTVSTIKSVKLGRVCNELRERIIFAEDTNRRLTETIGNCQSICGELGESVSRNVRTAREAVEIIEETRVIIKDLEDCCYGGNTIDDYYNYWDSIYGLQ